jgi:hypothetical protein
MLRGYNRLLAQHPVLTKTFSAFFLGIGGDALAQRIEYSSAGDNSPACDGTSTPSTAAGSSDTSVATRSSAAPTSPSAGAATTPGLFSAFPARVGAWYDAERGAAFASLATFWNGK